MWLRLEHEEEEDESLALLFDDQWGPWADTVTQCLVLSAAVGLVAALAFGAVSAVSLMLPSKWKSKHQIPLLENEEEL